MTDNFIIEWDEYVYEKNDILVDLTKHGEERSLFRDGISTNISKETIESLINKVSDKLKTYSNSFDIFVIHGIKSKLNVVGKLYKMKLGWLFKVITVMIKDLFYPRPNDKYIEVYESMTQDEIFKIYKVNNMGNKLMSFDEFVNEGIFSNIKDKLKSFGKALPDELKSFGKSVSSEFKSKKFLDQTYKGDRKYTYKELEGVCEDNIIPYVIAYAKNGKIYSIYHNILSEDDKKYEYKLFKFLNELSIVSKEEKKDKITAANKVEDFVNKGNIKDYIDFEKHTRTARISSKPDVFNDLQKFHKTIIKYLPRITFLFYENKWMALLCKDIYFTEGTLNEYQSLKDTYLSLQRMKRKEIRNQANKEISKDI